MPEADKDHKIKKNKNYSKAKENIQTQCIILTHTIPLISCDTDNIIIDFKSFLVCD